MTTSASPRRCKAGSGKTLAAFLASIDALGRLPPDAPPGVRVVYVSPLKALVYDIERNLRAPLIGIGRAAEKLKVPFRPVGIAVRTGDTSQRERQQQGRHPAEILVTTPESLFLILGSKAAATLRLVDTVHRDAGPKHAPRRPALVGDVEVEPPLAVEDAGEAHDAWVSWTAS